MPRHPLCTLIRFPYHRTECPALLARAFLGITFALIIQLLNRTRTPTRCPLYPNSISSHYQVKGDFPAQQNSCTPACQSRALCYSASINLPDTAYTLMARKHSKTHARAARFPIYLWIAGAYPILHLYAQNFGLVRDKRSPTCTLRHAQRHYPRLPTSRNQS